MELLPAIEIETGEHSEYAVIWLHGLGADGNDFAPIVPELRLPAGLGIRFVFPHAPQIPVTVNGGFVMPAWYDILEMQIDRKVDLEGLMASADAVTALVDREISRGIASERIVLAGFSQGGAVAYQAALSSSVPFAGLLVMSTYFATHRVVKFHEANGRIPIEIHHGLYDQVVPEHLGQEARDLLETKGYKPVYRTYPMEHGVCPEQLRDISSWFNRILAGDVKNTD